jgi:hypothetical protein
VGLVEVARSLLEVVVQFAAAAADLLVTLRSLSCSSVAMATVSNHIKGKRARWQLTLGRPERGASRT